MRFVLLISFLLQGLSGATQRIPNEAENIEFFVTFGKEGEKAWGDDDFTQTVFFAIPTSHKTPFYIRIFDPEVGGLNDEVKGTFNSMCKYDVYGGRGAHSSKASQHVDPVQGYRAGTMLASKVFGTNPSYDGKYYNMGPFNPVDGEFDPKMGAYIFKMIVQGVKGDDGNLYYFYLSQNPKINKAIDGANAFTYEYSFRMSSQRGKVAHVYPFADKATVSLTQYNFDFDNDGQILVYSVAKNRHPSTISGDNKWAKSVHKITAAEKNTSIDFQFVGKGSHNNNVVFYVKNQFDRSVGFYSIPIGGPPKYRYKVNINLSQKK